MSRRRIGLVVPLAFAGFIGLSLLASQLAWAGPFVLGDIFAGVDSGGHIKEFHSDGSFYQLLTTGAGNTFDTGMAFNASGDLYATNFFQDGTGGKGVSIFSHTTGLPTGFFGSGYIAAPESILVTSSAVYVGDAGSNILKQFDTGGTLIKNFTLATESRGTDWIDLGLDQKTMYYTSEGTHIKRFDVSGAGTQLTDFNAVALAGSAAYALRVIPKGSLAGEVLVADSANAYRLNTSGVVDKTYTIAGSAGGLFSLNLDADGTSFWVGDFVNGKLFKLDIASGGLLQTLDTGAGGGALFGVAIFGEICASGCTTAPEPGTPLLFASALVGLVALRGFRKDRLI